MSIYNSPTWTYIPEHLSISQLIESSSSSIHPEKIIYEEAITGATVTYKVFKRQVRRTAYNLRHLLHLRPGQTVSISASSCIDYILTAHAIWWAGGIVNPLNNSLHPDEIVHAINLAKPHILVVDQTLFQKLPNVLSELGRRAPVVFTICDHNDQRHLEWRRLPINRSHSLTGELELHTPIMKPNFVARNTCAAILLSSGTTGQPKAVMLSHYNLVAVCYQLREDNPSNWRGDQREIFFPPLSHVYATYVCFTMNLWLGAYVCLMPRFNVDLYCRLLQDRSATLARIVPPVARILAESPVVRKYKYPALEYFSCSAAPLHVGMPSQPLHWDTKYGL
jgi:acyl-CoA synthetase (AMP-forming)/AMP-acid ligase II